MNCCNEYGECRQGRDCPARRSMEDSLAAHYPAQWRKAEKTPRLDAVMRTILVISVLCLLNAGWYVWSH